MDRALPRPLVALLALFMAACTAQASPNELVVIAGAIRPDANGQWTVIEDADHAPRGIESVTSAGATVTVHFAQAGRVVTFVATPDESMLEYRVGASVGTDHAALTISPTPDYPLREHANIWVYGLVEP